MINQQDSLTIKNLYNKVRDVEEYISDNQQTLYEICPFTIILGAINTSERGYKNLYSTPNDYTSFAKVFTGSEALLTAWDNSYKIVNQNNPKTDTYKFQDYNGLKEYKVGDFFQGLLVRDDLSLNFTPSAQNDGFTQEQITKNVSVLIKNEPRNELIFNNINKYLYKVYMIPRLNIEIEFDNPSLKKPPIPDKLNPSNNVDKQWYYIANMTKIWDNKRRKISYLRVDFTSMNDKLSTSGFAINQYIQTSAPGEKCALPTIDIKNDEIALDEDFLRDLPITHIQITFYGSVVLSSVVFQGRPIDLNNVITLSSASDAQEKIFAPRLLFPYTYQAPIYDDLSLKGLSQNDYYIVWGLLTLDSYFQNWRELFAGKQLFDETNKKNFEGHYRSNKAFSRATNQIIHGTNEPTDDNYFTQGQHLPFWNNDFPSIPPITHESGLEQNINVGGNQYFTYTNPDDKTDIIVSLAATNEQPLDNIFNYKDVPIANLNGHLNNINMFSHFLNNPIYQIPLDIRETTSITLNSLPFIGGFLNKLFGGISIGFKTTKDLFANTPRFFGLMSCGNYDTIIDTLYAQNAKFPLPIPLPSDNNSVNAIIPLNTVDNTVNEIGALIGTKAVTTSFVFTLSDLIATARFDALSKHKETDTAITNTVYLNQKTKDNWAGDDYTTEKVFLVNENTTLLAPDNMDNSNKIKGFIIDGLEMKVLGKTDYKIDFFSLTRSNNEAIDYQYCVYTATYQSLSKVVDNVRLWTEHKVFSNPYFKFDEEFRYPREIIPPLPSDNNKNEVVIKVQDGELPCEVNFFVSQSINDTLDVNGQNQFSLILLKYYPFDLKNILINDLRIPYTPHNSEKLTDITLEFVDTALECSYTFKGNEVQRSHEDATVIEGLDHKFYYVNFLNKFKFPTKISGVISNTDDEDVKTAIFTFTSDLYNTRPQSVKRYYDFSKIFGVWREESNNLVKYYGVMGTENPYYDGNNNHIASPWGTMKLKIELHATIDNNEGNIIFNKVNLIPLIDNMSMVNSNWLTFNRDGYWYIDFIHYTITSLAKDFFNPKLQIREIDLIFQSKT